MMKKLLLLPVILLVLLTACTSEEAETVKGQDGLGSDVDAHGCIASAGYSWCEFTNQCERPWLLSQENGFENTLEKFQAFCNKKS